MALRAWSVAKNTVSGARLCKAAASEGVYDVVVVGSGMVGAAVAALLGKDTYTQHLRVLVIDKQAPKYNPDTIPALRVSTITPASADMLHRAGAWQELQPPHSAAFQDMHVWCTGTTGMLSWSARDSDNDEMGWVVENDRIQHALLAQLHPSTELVTGMQVEEQELPEYGPMASPLLARLRLQDGRSIATRLLVGADGANSRTRQLADLRTMGWAYPQRGVVCTVRTSEPNVAAWQRFLRTGPLALLPVRDGYSSIVWSTSPEAAHQLEALGPEEFGAAVTEAFCGDGGWPALPRLAASAARPPQVEAWVGAAPRSFPLQMKHAGRYTRGRLALVGDAAHAVHPMAGQGVNLGFGDAAALAEAVSRAVRLGQDFGSPAWLQEHYEAPRKRANTTMMAALDGLRMTFNVDVPLVAGARALGLGMLQNIPTVKNRIMQYAMGM